MSGHVKMGLLIGGAILIANCKSFFVSIDQLPDLIEHAIRSHMSRTYTPLAETLPKLKATNGLAVPLDPVARVAKYIVPSP